MNFLQTDELMQLMAEKEENQENYKTMHALLDEALISPSSGSKHPGMAKKLKDYENGSENDEGLMMFNCEFEEQPMSSTAPSETLESTISAKHGSEDGEQNCITYDECGSANSKRSSSKRRSSSSKNRQRSRRQGFQKNSKEKWTEVTQKLIALMRRVKKDRGDLGDDERLKRKAAFKKQVTVLLVPLFKKPKEVKSFLALLDAKERGVSEQKNEEQHHCASMPAEREELDKQTHAHNGENGDLSSANSPSTGKKSLIWSMFSVDWDSTRAQRRSVARERTMMKRRLRVEEGVAEGRSATATDSAQQQRSGAPWRRNRAVKKRRELEKKQWRRMKDEIIGRILEHIRMMVVLKHLCRPELLEKLKKEATACGARQSFDNFVAALPINESIHSWLGKRTREPEDGGVDSDAVIAAFMPPNRNRQLSTGQSARPTLSRQPMGETVAPAEHMMRAHTHSSTFSDLSCQLFELEGVLRSVLDDLDPEP